MDAVEQAQSGHPGTPMALAPVAYLLWRRHLRHDPAAPDWADRDRFVLSCGHASMLLYSLLHLAGYDLDLEEIRRFRQWGSKTPGHPERGHTPGVETTTGPLGQGVGNAVGMAMAEQLLAQRFNRPGYQVIDHRTWALVSDGDLMEGVASEAASLAGHLRLAKLTLIYDDNRITIDGTTELSFSEDVGLRFQAYGWAVLRVDDGNDLAAIDHALSMAVQQDRPTLIVLRTIIADPAPTKKNTSEAHGAPLGAEEIRRTREILDWPETPFHVPEEARLDLGRCVERGSAAHGDWRGLRDAWAAAHPKLAGEFAQTMAGQLPDGWDTGLPSFQAGSALATRQASSQVLNALVSRVPALVGGSADLAGSTGVVVKDGGVFTAEAPGRTIHWGIREHGMAACLNGMAAHGGIRPYGSTFLVFADYLKPSIRLAALMGLPVSYVFSHDSIGVGEDGPTHQPVEQVAMLRGIPNLVVLRPADATETTEAWRIALERDNGPTAIILTRQKLPVLDRSVVAAAAGTRQGGYVLLDSPKPPQVILIATGSEVPLALDAAAKLNGDGIMTRVVSMPSCELFAVQTAEYREQVLPKAIRARVVIEAGTSFGWHRWTTDGGQFLTMDRFGASAPGEKLFAEFGFTVERIVDLAHRALENR